MNFQANNLLLAGLGDWIPVIFVLVMMILSGLANAKKAKQKGKQAQPQQRQRPRRANVNAELQNEIDNFLREVQGRPAKPKPKPQPQQQPAAPVDVEDVFGQQREQRRPAKRPGPQPARKPRRPGQAQREVEVKAPEPQPERRADLKDHHLQTSKKKPRKKFTTNVSRQHLESGDKRKVEERLGRTAAVESVDNLLGVEPLTLVDSIHETMHDPRKIQTAWIIHEILSPPKSMR